MLLGPREASLSFNPKQDAQTTRHADVHRREASEMTGQQAPPPSVSVGRFLSSLRGPSPPLVPAGSRKEPCSCDSAAPSRRRDADLQQEPSLPPGRRADSCRKGTRSFIFPLAKGNEPPWMATPQPGELGRAVCDAWSRRVLFPQGLVAVYLENTCDRAQAAGRRKGTGRLPVSAVWLWRAGHRGMTGRQGSQGHPGRRLLRWPRYSVTGSATIRS